MKSFLFSLLLSCVFSTVFSQDFGLLNEEWVYDHDGGTSDGVTLVQYDRDTIVNNRVVRVFTKKLIRQINNEIREFEASPLFIYEENGVVESSKDLIYFDTLYDFNARVGTTLSFPERTGSGVPTGEVLERIVVDKFDFDFNGVLTPCLEVRNNRFIEIDTICEGVGSFRFYIEPFDYVQIPADGGEGGLLRCFNSEALGVISFTHPGAINGGGFSLFEYDCDQLNSIAINPVGAAKIIIFPNPTSDYLRLQSEKTPIENIKTYNLQGELIREYSSDGQEVEIGIKGLAPGIYILLINDSYYEKVVVQN